jgi:hypothetical protein
VALSRIQPLIDALRRAGSSHSYDFRKPLDAANSALMRQAADELEAAQRLLGDSHLMFEELFEMGWEDESEVQSSWFDDIVARLETYLEAPDA